MELVKYVPLTIVGIIIIIIIIIMTTGQSRVHYQ